MKKFVLGSMALAIALTVVAQAQAPKYLPIRGFLEDATGTPIDGTATITFGLYTSATSASPIFSEVQNVSVSGGQLSANIGAAEPLDLTLFRDNPEVWLGIKVNNDPEMNPRILLGSVPYAAYAEYCNEAATVTGQAQGAGGVPSGAVMFFDLPSCPDGWTELAAAQGRTLVGLPPGGTGLGTVGTPLANLEDRAHTHSVDPASVDSASAGSHSHAVDPPSTASTAAGAHNHAWFDHDTTLAQPLRTFDSSGAYATTTVGSYTVSTGSPATTFRILSQNTTGYTDNEANHAHDVNVPSFTSSADGAHAHAVDVGATVSAGATTGEVMPYVQLRVCRKN